MLDLDEVLRTTMRAHGLPSVSLCVRVDGREVFHATHGLARRAPDRRAAEDQPYDLASLTKALVTAPVTAALVAARRLRWEQPVGEIVPDVDPRITVAHLLCHAAGYPAWRPLYAETIDAWGLAETRRALLRAARATPLQSAPGEAHCYSDLGFLVLLELIESVGEAPLDVLFREHVLEPAAVEDLQWGWPCAAATEDCPIRGAVVEGTVHDLNCAALGGVSTHAGLFGPARAVALLAERLMLAALGDPRAAALPGRALRRQWTLTGPGTHRGGWDTPSPQGYTSVGRFFPRDALGHLGYTGTSVWVVPTRRTTVALLTNRIHPHDDLTGIRAARPTVHDAVAQALGWTQES